MNCYAQGYNAYTVGMKFTENPFRDLDDHSEWSKGWLSAKKGDPIYYQDCV